MENILSH